MKTNVKIEKETRVKITKAQLKMGANEMKLVQQIYRAYMTRPTSIINYLCSFEKIPQNN